jgi:polysaccharide export outer membrane protein
MKYTFYNIAVVLSFLLVCTSCITNKDKLYLQGDRRTEVYTVPFEQYTLSVNDEIHYYLMSTSQETQVLFNSSVAYRIYEDGCVVLPHVGRVRIVGLTIREAEKTITDRLRSFVLDPEVKIALANNFFYVHGNGSGQFQLYKEDLNIFQALAMSGDISSIGDRRNVKIIRKGTDGVDHIQTFDLRKKSIIGSEYYYIRPNDVIYIPTSSKAFFRVESVSSFFSLFIAPLSLVMMALTFFK